MSTAHSVSMDNPSLAISAKAVRHRRKSTPKVRRRKENNGIEKKNCSDSMRHLRTPSNSSKSWKEDTCWSQVIISVSLKLESYRRITMQSNQFVELEALVQAAEVHRQGQKTA